jgi:hypothetical protein
MLANLAPENSVILNGIKLQNVEADYKAYLVEMTTDNKVQFVCFETSLDSEPFMKRWKAYNRSPRSDADVILQQSKKDGLFLYIAQHRFERSDVQFEFTKEGRSGRVVQERIKTTIAGGYGLMQLQNTKPAAPDESKIFAFIDDVTTDLAPYKELANTHKLNIYQAYFQNCMYAYILEYFVKNKYAPQLAEQLEKHDATKPGIYREFAHIKNTASKKEQANFIWPG